jgi:hypothetical protein
LTQRIDSRQTRKTAKVKANREGLTHTYFVHVLFHVKHLKAKQLIRKVFNSTIPAPRRPDAAATAGLQAQKPTCFDRFFARKRKKTRKSHQFYPNAFNRKLNS